MDVQESIINSVITVHYITIFVQGDLQDGSGGGGAAGADSEDARGALRGEVAPGVAGSVGDHGGGGLSVNQSSRAHCG
jgi:hypothetical protein